MDKKELSGWIKQRSLDLGFDQCGISKAEFLQDEAPRLEKWLKNNAHGKMHYMENHFDKRLNPTLLHQGAKSVISFSLNYFPEDQQRTDTYKISKYAYGKDYHFVIKKKLKQLLSDLTELIGDVNGRAFVDSAPVMDKAWAQKSGLGWMGKHTNILSKKKGSFFFLAEILIDLELEYDGPVTDHCGSCTACIDACPTDAIVEPYQLDGSKCISYLTIELKENLPSEFSSKMEDWVFGCDICQDVCPWNRFSKPNTTTEFNGHPSLLDYSKKEWEEITDEVFQVLFKQSAVKRTKIEGLKRNIAFVSKKL